MSRKIIAVVGATGQQGGSVVRALRSEGTFAVRAITRDASKATDLADEVVEADLDRPETLEAAFAGAHGAFVVTNFWAGADELAQGRAAVAAAKKAGVQHFIWSTLPNVHAISDGRFEVVHFTQKAKVDEAVRDAGFEAYTFVEAPFYFQNLAGVMAPLPQDDGTRAWFVPMATDAKVIHMGNIGEIGALVLGAFLNPERVGQGARLAQAGSLASWNDVVNAFRAVGHRVAVYPVAAEAYDGFYPGAPEMREMMEYFQAYTYFGPDAEEKVALADAITTTPFSDLSSWARVFLAPPPRSQDVRDAG